LHAFEGTECASATMVAATPSEASFGCTKSHSKSKPRPYGTPADILANKSACCGRLAARYAISESRAHIARTWQLHGRSRVARHAIVALVRCMLRAGKASLSCLDLAPASLGFLTGCRGSLHFRAGGGEAAKGAGGWHAFTSFCPSPTRHSFKPKLSLASP